MKSVLVAGATGYLGRHVVNQYLADGWNVRALVRNVAKARREGLDASEMFEAEATEPLSLFGAADGMDLVISSLGITRQRDGLSYWDVDYQANLNLLVEATRANVARFAYVHVLNADKMPNVPLVVAKQAFVDDLRRARIKSTVFAPSGFFSDMTDFLTMARTGQVWLFGSGQNKLNPIDGADLAAVMAQAIQQERDFVPVGGPQTLTQIELAQAAFAALDQPANIVRLPDGLRRLALRLLPYVTPKHVRGPAQFFLTAMGMDMVGPSYGTKRLGAYFAGVVQSGTQDKTPPTAAPGDGSVT